MASTTEHIIKRFDPPFHNELLRIFQGTMGGVVIALTIPKGFLGKTSAQIRKVDIRSVNEPDRKGIVVPTSGRVHATVNDISDYTGIATSQINRELKKLVDMGLIRQEKDKTRNRGGRPPMTYWITSASFEHLARMALENQKNRKRLNM